MMYRFTISDEGKDQEGNQRSEESDELKLEKGGMACFARKSQLPVALSWPLCVLIPPNEGIATRLICWARRG